MTLELNARARDRWVAAMAESVPAGSRVIDVGAGPCRYRPLFAHCTYEAHDFARYEGGEGEDWGYGALDHVSDITSIPVEADAYDAILCTEVLEHVPRPLDAIRELGRILRPAGRLFLTAPLGSGLHQEPYHFYGGFTPWFYELALAEAGLVPVSIEPNGGLYQLLAQELERGWSVAASSTLPRLHPDRLAARALASRPVIAALGRLERRIPVPGFTVGYHVVATKPAGEEGA